MTVTAAAARTTACAQVPQQPDWCKSKWGANDEIGAMAREETEDVLGKVLYEASLKMKNGFNREDG